MQRLKRAISASAVLLLLSHIRSFSLLKLDLWRKFALLTIALSLVACQTAPKNPGQATVNERPWLTDTDFFSEASSKHLQRTRWRYSAKVGIKTPQLQEQANLVWQFSDQSNDVRLFGPLGVGTVKLQFDEYGVQLSDNQRILHQGDSAEALLTEVVGWPIPIDALSYWLQGLPLPEKAFRYQINDTDDLASLQQLNWLITYSSYREYDGQRLARKLVATKRVTPDQAITVKLITKNWQWR